jgi:hypothetical protein
VAKMLETLRKLRRKLQRAPNGLGYSLRILGAPTRRLKPSTTMILLVVLGFVGFILAGGIYDILERPLSLLYSPSGVSVRVKGSLGQQTLNESLMAMFLYMLGLGGLYMLVRSTRFAYRPRNAYLLLILGTVTVLLVVFYSNSLITSKIGG